MMQSLPALPFPTRLIAGRKAARQPWLWAGALLLASLLLLATVPSYAIDLVNLGAIGEFVAHAVAPCELPEQRVSVLEPFKRRIACIIGVVFETNGAEIRNAVMNEREGNLMIALPEAHDGVDESLEVKVTERKRRLHADPLNTRRVEAGRCCFDLLP